MINLRKLCIIGCLSFTALPNFPPKLTHLEMDEFIPNLKIFPSSITHLKFRHNFTNFGKLQLPQNITHLDVGLNFKGDLDSNFPTTITHLKFGQSFNRNIYNLPPNLIYVQFGNSFDQPIDNLPKFLKFLILQGTYHFPFTKLPPQLEMLILENYDIPISPSVIPDSLKILHICASFTHSTDFSKLTGTYHLEFRFNFANTLKLSTPVLGIFWTKNSYSSAIRGTFFSGF